MSRHRLVRNLHLNDELDDFDGGADDDYDFDDAEGNCPSSLISQNLIYELELSEEDHEKLRDGTIAVRASLPLCKSYITDKEIQESLWHTFYNVEKTVEYLLRMHSDKPKAGKISKKKSSKEFFKDTPWLKVPKEREAILVAPPYPRGGLLGGSGEPPKMSKLQALAAARRKNISEIKNENGVNAAESLAKLKLSQNRHIGASSGTQNLTSNQEVPQKTSRGFPIRKRQPLVPIDQSIAYPKDKLPDSKDSLFNVDQETSKASPSEFANTMFSRISRPNFQPYFSMPYAASTYQTADPFAGPSPDDIVLAAQSKATASGAKNFQPKSKKEGHSEEIIGKFESITIDDVKPQLKKLDVPKEFRNQVGKNTANFVVIGHVDAGKSTLMGRLLLDLGVVEQRTVDRYKKEADSIGKSSFAIAWVFDQGSEERARGVTIDIAMNKFETPNTSFTVLDAPGHRDFIPNMIAGASQADFAVLVIDASTGSFESGLKGQTKEHTLLVRSMGVQRIIVAINKLDTVGWSEERFTEIKNQISSFLTTAGFHAKNISIVPCSGLLGDNVINRSQNSAAKWYNGQTLIETLDVSGPISRNIDKPLRMTIFDVFRGGQQNPVSLNGRVDSGTLQVGETLLAQPSGQTCIVKALEFDNQTVNWAVSGQIITIHLSGIGDQHLKAGDVLCSASSPIRNIKEFTAKILAFEFILPMKVEIHKGRLHTTGRVKNIECILNKTTGTVVGKPPKVVKPGMLARVVVEVDLAVPLESPGRVVLRSDGCTIAAGLIE
ncbi:elongation factor Tu GTP binding domain-containing protein [Blumeria hordei DH14]|uniref:Elongation factor 1 alpha-like protein n=1 Tax=Blumeria graminis f. sp. hordei (strain DH14) TaxID=546991 RepID=N1J7F8_BLUG1|nr:elongation factor Tu GTP binding domain-containing protein [Blumeria hordei DH14]